MELKELLNYQNIVVQCHDNPDADAVASGYAVYQYLKKHDKNVNINCLNDKPKNIYSL